MRDKSTERGGEDAGRKRATAGIVSSVKLVTHLPMDVPGSFYAHRVVFSSSVACNPVRPGRSRARSRRAFFFREPHSQQNSATRLEKSRRRCHVAEAVSRGATESSRSRSSATTHASTPGPSALVHASARRRTALLRPRRGLSNAGFFSTKQRFGNFSAHEP